MLTPSGLLHRQSARADSGRTQCWQEGHHPWDPNDGNKASRAFAALGVTSKTVPSQHLVVEIGNDAGRYDVIVHYSSVHLVNQELQTYLERANQAKRIQM